MAKPNKTVGRNRPDNPKAREARDRQFRESEMARDMEAFQRGEMTAEAFLAKWDRSQ